MGVHKDLKGITEEILSVSGLQQVKNFKNRKPKKRKVQIYLGTREGDNDVVKVNGKFIEIDSNGNDVATGQPVSKQIYRVLQEVSDEMMNSMG